MAASCGLQSSLVLAHIGSLSRSSSMDGIPIDSETVAQDGGIVSATQLSWRRSVKKLTVAKAGTLSGINQVQSRHEGCRKSCARLNVIAHVPGQCTNSLKPKGINANEHC